MSESRLAALERRMSAGWQVDKRVSIPNVVSVLAILVGGLWWLHGYDTRVTLLEMQYETTEKSRQALARRLERIENKLDRALYSGFKRGVRK